MILINYCETENYQHWNCALAMKNIDRRLESENVRKEGALTSFTN